MPCFDFSSSISQDTCARRKRNEQDCRILKYNTNGFKDLSNTNEHVKNRILTSNKKMQCTDGYGVTPAHIDEDSKLRYMINHKIRGPEKHQLYSRIFVAVPDFSRGTLIPNIDSRLRIGVDTDVDQPCRSISEVDYDRNEVFDGCMTNYLTDGYYDAINEFDKFVRFDTRQYKSCEKLKKN